MQGRRFDGGRKVAPVKVGAEIDVRIEGVGEKGDGIAKVQGFVVFVPGVKEGDEVRIKVTRVLSKVGFGEVIEKGEKSTEESSEGEESTEEDSSEEEDKEGADESDEDSVEGGDDSQENFDDAEDSENF